MIYTNGDVVESTADIGSSGGLMRSVPPGVKGIVTYVYPDGEMVSPWDGVDYRLKVKFPGYLNVCRCMDGCYHVAEAEVSKIEVTDRDIWDFFEGAERQDEEDAASD